MRDTTVDNVKGLAITTVVFAHVTMGFSSAGALSQQFILQTMPFYVWYMPIFFFASGLFLDKTLCRVSGPRFVGRKVIELGYPFVIWSLIFGGLQMFFSGYTNTGSISIQTVLSGVLPWSPREHMWFLPALFVVFAVAAVCRTLWPSHWRWIFLALGVAGFVGGMYVSDHSQLLQYAIWTGLGVATSRGQGQSNSWVLRSSRVGVDALLFTITLISFVIVALYGLGPGRNFQDRGVLFILACSLGIGLVFVIGRILSRSNRASALLSPVGRASLHIYLTHVPVLAAMRIFLTKVLNVTFLPASIGLSLLACVLLGLGAAELDRRGVLSLLFRKPSAPSLPNYRVRSNDLSKFK